MLLRTAIIELNEVISDAQKGMWDLSKEYTNSNSEEFQLQQRLRIATDNLRVSYLSRLGKNKGIVNRYSSKKTFDALQEAKKLFGEHPFHHVIEGRLAQLVKEANKNEKIIPGKYGDYYLDFSMNPWNDPELNYNTPLDIIGNGSEEDRRKIPPEWKPQ